MFRIQKGFVCLKDIYRLKDCDSKFQTFISEAGAVVSELEEVLSESLLAGEGDQNRLFGRTSPLYRTEPALRRITSESFNAGDLSNIWVHPALAVSFLCYVSPLYQARVCVWASSARDIFSMSLETLTQLTGHISFENYIDLESNK